MNPPYGTDEWLAAANTELAAKPCGGCQTIGGMVLTFELHAHPIGIWSLAGAQLKTSASRVLVARHDACGFRAVASPTPTPNPGPSPEMVSEAHRDFHERYVSYDPPPEATE